MGLEDVCVLYLRWKYKLKLIDYCINAANLSRRIDEICVLGVECQCRAVFLYHPHWHRDRKTPPRLVELLLCVLVLKKLFYFLILPGSES